MRKRVAQVALAAALSATCAQATGQSAMPAVDTFAGSGDLGIADGAANAASFVAPMGVARAPDGRLFVSDPPAQRIRVIDARGNVATFAGSGALDPQTHAVAGGFADGPRASAKFDHPSGLAVMPNGDLLVADTFNHCVRRLDASQVTTYAGICGKLGTTTGDRGVALLAFPRAIALGPDGSLYVGQSLGIRVFGPDLRERVLEVPVGNVNGLSIAGNVLFASDERGFVRLDLRDPSKARRFENAEYQDGRPGNFEAFDRVGHPNGVYAISPQSVIYSDLVDNSLSLWTSHEGDLDVVRHIGAAPSVDADRDGGSFRDGSAGDARFNGPQQIAPDGRGGFYVADAANRRIRRLSAFDASPDDLSDEIARAARSHAARRAFLLGNSFANFNSAPQETIAADATRALASSGASRIEVFGGSLVGASNAAIEQYVDQYLADASITDLVLVENRISINESYLNGRQAVRSDYAAWGPKYAADVRELAATLRARRVRLFVVLFPTPNELAAGESQALLDHAGVADLPWTWLHDQLLEATRAAGAETIDLWPAFSAAIERRDRVALFATDDIHPTRAGRALAAQEIAAALAASR